MIVTDKKYSMDKAYLKILDLYCDRCNHKNPLLDAVMLVDGDEGSGKTTMSVLDGYYCAQKLGRPFNINHLFFDIDKMIKFAQTTERQVIVWDEAALAGLAMDWHKKAQKKLIRFLMISRKKQHLYFFNVPKFFKLNEYLAVDRSIGLTHVYARKEINLGRFTYYRKKRKENLFEQWKRYRSRGYKKVSHIRGSFPDAMKKIIDMNKYDEKKEDAILNLLEKESMTKKEERLIMLRHEFVQAIKRAGMTTKEFSKFTSFSQKSLDRWRHLPEKYPNIEYYEIK